MDASLRNFELIGGAAGYVPPHIAAANPNVLSAKLRALRHVVAHASFGVNLPIIWETIVRRLPKLRAALQAIPRPRN